MGYEHSITIPGITTNNTVKRTVRLADGNDVSFVVLGSTDNLISFTATNPSVTYSYKDEDASGNGSWVGPFTVGTPIVEPEPAPVEPPAPEAPTIIEGDSVVVPVSGV